MNGSPIVITVAVIYLNMKAVYFLLLFNHSVVGNSYDRVPGVTIRGYSNLPAGRQV